MAEQGELQRLLDLCDEIRAIRKKIQDPGLTAATLSRLKRRSREKLGSLAADLGGIRFRGSLKGLFEGLEPEHFLVLATLLRRHLRSSTPAVEGRVLLAAMFDSSFELLRGLQLLHPASVLRSNGLILVESEDEGEADADLLDCRFCLAAEVVDAFLEELGCRPTVRGQQLGGYQNQEDFLVELKHLHNMHRARAKRVFSPESWWRLSGAWSDRAQRAVSRRILSLEKRIEWRLRQTADAEEFPIQKFCIDQGLTKNELLIVLHLVFVELLEGNPYADVVALIQLVSGSEEEFIANRRLFAPESTLRRRDIIEMDQMLEGRELTSECYLGNWVLDKALGPVGGRGPIDADERLNFHLYLKRLGSSGFLQDL
ncbi:MAG: hypothetical protein CMJ85_00410 [Planctomycetes bacterium]|jgi:hypothetical protein|nr:hypothetical protein [Planctomycetota bacterium]MDP6425272.1 hypothetical protein [Planctomycetota bacterium]